MLPFSDQRHRTPQRLVTKRLAPPPAMPAPPVTAHLKGCRCEACWTDWIAYGAIAAGFLLPIAYDLIVQHGAGVLTCLGVW